MKKFLTAVPLALATGVIALSVNANAQTPTANIVLNGLGSSALFLEAGLGATTTPISATCVWSSNNNPSATPSNVVQATDSTVTPAESDAGNAWVAWTTGSGGTCDTPASDAKVYAYLQTDSVVGNRCLFNAPSCHISYPVFDSAHANHSANLILGVGNEHDLPQAISNALNDTTKNKVNYAGTDIRPEDAWFATRRALAACGTPVVSGSQYKGLGYANGANIASTFSSSVFHVIDFTLPAAPGYVVTPVGATPILVVVNGPSTTSGFGAHTFSNISSANLAKFLDGTFTTTGQATGGTGGSPVTTLIREPLSGTFNTMEFNVPNTTVLQTSQENGNCPITNPLSSTGPRKRAIGTGQELNEVIDTTTNGNVLGYAFWSVANFAGFTSTAAPNARYLTVDGIDPLITTSGNHNGIIPLSGSSDLANVTLSNINIAPTATNPNPANYPIWSLIRFVSNGSTAPADLTNLSTSTQNFVTSGSSSSRPDFIKVNALTVVRSHFVPPLPTNQPSPAANGRVGLPSSNCSKAELGGDVGGVVLSLALDSSTCSGQPITNRIGTTNERR